MLLLMLLLLLSTLTALVTPRSTLTAQLVLGRLLLVRFLILAGRTRTALLLAVYVAVLNWF